MKLLTTSCILAALSFVSALADIDPSPTTLSPAASTVTDAPSLELRQVGVGLVDPNAALTGATAMGAVTQYEAAGVAVLYTQLFSPVPDQWPSAKPGVIGMGNDAKLKRDVEAVPTMVEEARVVQTEYMMQPVVVQMVTEVVTVPVRRATSVVVVETVTMGYANGTAGNGTALGSNGTTVASVGFGSYRPLATGTMR